MQGEGYDGDMERPYLHLVRVYVVAAMAVMGLALTAWAVWGSPSNLSLAWVAIVGVGLVLAAATAVRAAGPTRSVAHVLYDTENPNGLVPAPVNTGNGPGR